MSEPEDWKARSARYARFRETDLGKLYGAYDRALIAYWQHDADEHISDRRLKELDDASRAATNAFVAKLMELAGV